MKVVELTFLRRGGGGEGCGFIPFRAETTDRSIACKHSRWPVGEFVDVEKVATTVGKAANTLAVSTSLTSSGLSHFVATSSVG